MNYDKILELFRQNKKYAISILIGLIVLVGAILTFHSSANSELITPNSAGKQGVSYSVKPTKSDKAESTSKMNVSNSSDANYFSADLPQYDYKEAADHIGERAIVTGTVVQVFTSKTNTTFLDFCKEFSNCPFTAVIFASDLEKFGDVKKYERSLRISGLIKSYNGKAEIILDDPGQVD